MTLQVAILVEGTFIPSREGATRRFSALARNLSWSGIGVTVVHCYRGWSDANLIAQEPFTTYFLPPDRFYGDLDLMARILVEEGASIAITSDFETVLKLGVPLKARMSGLRLVFEAHDVATDFQRSLGVDQSIIDRTRSAETRALMAADQVVCFTGRDETSLRNMVALAVLGSPGRKPGLDRAGWLTRLPFGCEGVARARKLDHPLRSLLFLGNLYHRPNARALDFLASVVMPKVRGKLPDVRCLVVGDVPPALKVKHASEFFMFLGQVDDLGSVLSASHLALSPIFTGSGIKVKVLDYAAAGLPILCSSESLEGIASESSDVSAFAAEDDPARYAQRITELLGAPAELDRLATAARSVVSRQLWPTIAQRTAGFYRDAAVRPPKGILTSPEATAVDVPQPYFLDDYFDQSRFGQSAETARKYLRRGGYGKLEAWPDKGTAG